MLLYGIAISVGFATEAFSVVSWASDTAGRYKNYWAYSFPFVPYVVMSKLWGGGGRGRRGGQPVVTAGTASYDGSGAVGGGQQGGWGASRAMAWHVGIRV